jgi:hypothetical protein
MNKERETDWLEGKMSKQKRETDRMSKEDDQYR